MKLVPTFCEHGSYIHMVCIHVCVYVFLCVQVAVCVVCMHECVHA